MQEPFRYRVVVEWSDRDGAFLARVPAFAGLAAHGATEEEALREAREAALGMLEVLQEDGDPLPQEDTAADYSGQLRLRLPRWLHEQLARRAQIDGVSLNQEMVAILAAGSGMPGAGET